MHTNLRFRAMTHAHTRFMTHISAFAIQEFRTLFISNTQRGRERERESERESSKGHQEVYPERKRMLFCLWEGTSSWGWETSLFLKSCFGANSLSERKTMTERETPYRQCPTLSPLSAEPGKEDRKRDREDTFRVGVWTIGRYEL